MQLSFLKVLTLNELSCSEAKASVLGHLHDSANRTFELGLIGVKQKMYVHGSVR